MILRWPAFENTICYSTVAVIMHDGFLFSLRTHRGALTRDNKKPSHLLTRYSEYQNAFWDGVCYAGI